jgi:hypothetical protein
MGLRDPRLRKVRLEYYGCGSVESLMKLVALLAHSLNSC